MKLKEKTMEIAVAMVGIGLTVFGIVLVYMWKSNGELQENMLVNQKQIIEIQAKMVEGQEKMMESQEKMGENQVKMGENQAKFNESQENIIKILERMDAREEKQTKILEAIEGKL